MALQGNEVKIPRRILNTLLNSLTAGVVPRSGAPYIAIGRREEINSLLDNLDDVADGGAACRFLIGRYGSGKSFLIQLIRGYALERGFVCADADLSPERRLTGGNGAGLATYRELIINLAVKASPEGGALPTVLSRYFTGIRTELVSAGIMPDTPEFETELKKRVFLTLSELEGDVGGFDFARVLSEYYMACISDDNDKKSNCLRWLRGEFSTKTEAKSALGFSVSTVINDDNWYDYIKLLASLCVRLGYKGLIVFIDECVNLYKIPNRISREANYEKILVLSHLIAIHIKGYLGKLSALCGCVIASTGSACGLVYLRGGDYGQICSAIKNMIGNITGMVCDGAKVGCAMKVASGVSSALQSAVLAREGMCISEHDGIIEKDIEKTIQNLGRIGSVGMQNTDNMILDIMVCK